MRVARPLLARTILGTALAFVSFSAALADVIDGEWCHTDGRHMSIKGPEIVTPRGTHITGDYTRHSFVYVVPQPEPQAGQTVSMILINEQTVTLTVAADKAGTAQAPREEWRRCVARTS